MFRSSYIPYVCCVPTYFTLLGFPFFFQTAAVCMHSPNSLPVLRLHPHSLRSSRRLSLPPPQLYVSLSQVLLQPPLRGGSMNPVIHE